MNAAMPPIPYKVGELRGELLHGHGHAGMLVASDCRKNCDDDPECITWQYICGEGDHGHCLNWGADAKESEELENAAWAKIYGSATEKERRLSALKVPHAPANAPATKAA